MPKEIIRNASQVGDDDQYRVDVRWNRKLYCQIATVKDPDAYRGEGARAEGFFVDLDRDALNRLIRVLRKARDQAYGSDA